MYYIKYNSIYERNKEICFDTFEKALGYANELNRFDKIHNMTISFLDREIVALRSIK
jgi:hypothetical protein